MRISDWSSDVCSSDLLSERISVDVDFRDVRSAGGHQEADARRDEIPRIPARSRIRNEPIFGLCSFLQWQRQLRFAPGPNRAKFAGERRRPCAHIHRSAVRKYRPLRSEEHTSELQSLMRISYAV